MTDMANLLGGIPIDLTTKPWKSWQRCDVPKAVRGAGGSGGNHPVSHSEELGLRLQGGGGGGGNHIGNSEELCGEQMLLLLDAEVCP